MKTCRLEVVSGDSDEQLNRPETLALNQGETVKRLLFLCITILMGVYASSCGGEGTLTVKDPWARPTLVGQNAAIYFVIDNATRQDDTLLSIRGEIADSMEAHLSTMDANGVVSMKPQESVFVPAGEQVKFEPGGLHVMVVDIAKDLQVGDTFQVVLTFRNAGEVPLDVPVVER